MGYVVYHTETTRKLIDKSFKSEAAAKAGLTRECKANRNLVKADYAVADTNEFHDSIEKMVTKTNMMSGLEYEERVNTPSYCSPSSEAYWSM